MPVIAPSQPWNTATFSATAIWCAALVERLEIGVGGAAVDVAQLVAARARSRPAPRRAAAPAAGAR